MNITIQNLSPAYSKVTNQRNVQIPFSHHSPQFTSQNQKNDTFELSVGYVNDIHGQINNMMRILSGLKGDICLSAGDNDIGDEKNSSIHKATVKFLNMAKIKASALGNHEMDTTQSDFTDTMNTMETEILAANVKKDDDWAQRKDNVPSYGRNDFDKQLKASSVVEVKGEKIGLVGTAPIDMAERLTHPNYHSDLIIPELDDTIELVQDEVEKLKGQGINKIFLLSHLGNAKDKILAQKTDGIDVIIGGHTHELIKDIKEGENLFANKSGEPVIITEAGRDGNYFGQLNLTFNKDGVITKAQNNVISTAPYSKNLVNQYIFHQIIGKPEVVGYVNSSLPQPLNLASENPHANYVCDIMREESDADIAIWHNSGVRSFFREGLVDSSDIKDMTPFLDYLVIAPVSEKTLVKMFNSAIEKTYSSKYLKPGLFAVSGLDYTVDIKNKRLAELNYTDKNGTVHKIDVNNPSDTKFYRVITDEFLMSAGADYEILAEPEDYIKKYAYDKDVMICDYLKKHPEPININHLGRIKFINE